MISKQLLNYIEKEDKLGKSKNEVENILLSAGWHKDAIAGAFDIYYKEEVADKGLSLSEPQETDSYQKKLSEPLELETPHDMLLEDGNADTAKKIEVSAKQSAKNKETERGVVSEGLTLGEDRGSVPPRELKPKKRRVRPVFLIILSFVLGTAITLSLSIFFLNNQTKDAELTTEKSTEFEAQKIDDSKRIAGVLVIQKNLEKYYDEHKSYPENINSLLDIPTVSSELNYAYTPIGLPPQSYTLNIEMKNTDDGEFKIEGGFMTLKNKQGTK